MPIGRSLFVNQTITATTAAPSVTVPAGQVDWISLGVVCSAVSGVGASAQIVVQWSFDGNTWADLDPEDTVCTFTATGYRVKRMPVKASYWRLGAIITGTAPSFTLTGNCLTW